MKIQQINHLHFKDQENLIPIWESDNTGDMVDRAQRQTDYFNWVALREISQKIDRQKHHAQELSAQGLTGLCEKCGKQIPKARLHASKNVTRCLNCQVVHESGQ